MKKRMLLVLMAVAMLFVLSSCVCEHEWIDANCLTPKTCSLCEETEGEPLGHDWLPAECTLPERCSRCDETVGEALGHTWVDADCVTPKTCSVCAETEGEPLGHAWVDADCVTPKTCSVCGETEGEALGHTFVEATCAAPETCSACGETKGETLPHTYGKLIIREEQMVHVCEVCQAEETFPLDYDAYLQDHLRGEWITMAGFYQDNMYLLRAGIRQEFVGIYLNFLEDHQVQFYCDSLESPYQLCTWTLDEESLNDEYSGYFIDISSETDSWTFQYVIEDDFPLITTPGLNPFEVCCMYHNENDQVAQTLSQSQWIGFDEANAIYTIRFNEDYTFTGHQGGMDVSGRWFLRDAYLTEYGGAEGDIVLSYQKDEQPCLVPLRVHFSSSSDSLEEATKLAYAIETFSYNNQVHYDYNQSDTEISAAEIEQMIADLPKQLAGTWTSLEVRDFSGDNTVTTSTTDYTITLLEDGTFAMNDALAAFTGWEANGTWEVRSQSINYEGELDADLTLIPSGSEGSVYGYFQNHELSFYQNDIRIAFAVMTEEDIALLEKAAAGAKDSLIGEWTSVLVHDFTSDVSAVTFTVDYTISFLEDGTFVISDALAAALGKETTGTWDIEGVELVEYSSSGTSISGYLCFADNDQVYFSQRDEELNLYNNSITTELRKLTQEEIDALLKGTDALIGEWTSVRVSEGAEEAEDTSYHLTIAEDGTFTANAALVPVLQSATGTWALADYVDGMYRYNFQPAGVNHAYYYDLLPDGELNLWARIGEDQWLDIYLTKD